MNFESNASMEHVSPLVAGDGQIIERNSVQIDDVVAGLAPLVSVGIAVAGLVIGIGSGILLNL